MEWRSHDGTDTPQLTRRRFLSTLLSGLASICALPTARDYPWGNGKLLAEAAELAREVITVDLHCHPNRLGSSHFPALDPDVPDAMKAGGLDAGLFAVRGDYPVIRRDASGRRYEWRQPRAGELFQKAQEQLDNFLVATKSGKIVLSGSPAEILEAKKNGLPSAVLAIEGSDPLEDDLSHVKFFYDKGVRVLQLVHYRINEIGDIQTADPRHKGLTPFGREVVKEMNRLGMVIDTAHASSQTLEIVLAESRHPVLFSHTGPYTLRQIARHLEDKDMRAIAKKGGVIGIWPLVRRRETFDTFLKYMDYVKNLVGADHVGVGTDLFGLRDSTSIPTHKEFALVAAGLLSRGYLAGDIEKILGGNFMRIFREISNSKT